MPKGDRIIKELDVLRKNIQELQGALQHAYIRIGELTNDLHDLQGRRTKTDEQLEHESKVFLVKADDEPI